MAKSDRVAMHMRFKRETKAALDEAAKERGKSATKIVDEAVKLYTGLPTEFVEKFEEMAKPLNLPVPVVICNLLIQWVAFQGAWAETIGGEPPGIMRAFKFSSKGLMVGDELMEAVRSEYEEILAAVVENTVEAAKAAKGKETFHTKMGAAELHSYATGL